MLSRVMSGALYSQASQSTCSVIIICSSLARLVALHMWLFLVPLHNLFSASGLLWALVVSHTHQPGKADGNAFDCICHARCCLMHRADGQVGSLHFPHHLGLKPHIWQQCLTIPAKGQPSERPACAHSAEGGRVEGRGGRGG